MRASSQLSFRSEHLVDEFLVLFLGDTSLELHGWGKLSSWNGEVIGEEFELAHMGSSGD